MSDSQPLRNENGQLLPGETANPKGNNGQNKGWQPYSQRIQKWFNLPVAEVAAYLDNNGERLRQMSSIDAACIRHVINTYSGKDPLRYLREALDRIEGTPKQTVQLQGDKDKPVELKFSLDFHSPDQGDPVTSPDAAHDSQLPAAEALPKAK